MEFTMIETGWLSLLPPIIAIALALLTKEVYSSLFIGLFSGIAGLVAAYYLDTGVGAAVVLCAAVCYGITLPLRRRVR